MTFDRIEQNGRKSVMLFVLSVLFTIPFIGVISFGVTELTLAQFGPRVRQTRALEEGRRRELSSRLAGDPAAAQSALRFDPELRKLREEREREQASATTFRAEMVTVVGLGIAGILGLVFWSVAASPTSKILTMCGARPPTLSENAAREILDKVSHDAGLRAPKLYIIDSPAANILSAGSDPRASVIAVTQGLLLLLTPEEFECVLAHELSHIGNADTRLNTLVTAMALFLRLPYLMLKRRMEKLTSSNYEYIPLRQRGWYRFLFLLASLPAILYLFVIAPALATIIRSMISRNREFLADRDAVEFTQRPQDMVCALAKVGGAGAVLGASNPIIAHLYFADPAIPSAVRHLFRGGFLATHPPIDKRISRLQEQYADVSPAAIATAVRDGAEFCRRHQPVVEEGASEAIKRDEISVLTAGNPMGRVFRVLSATPVYDQPDATSFIVARVPAGALMVVFDDPGRFRQVLTHDQTFGYMPASIKLQKVDMLPSEISDPAARARAGAPDPVSTTTYATEPADTPEIAKVTVRYIEPIVRGGDNHQSAAVLGARTRLQKVPAPKLSPKQLAFATVFGIAIFAGLFLVMIQYGGK